VHDVAVAQDTFDKELLPGPTGVGVGWVAQVVPFHCSASVPPPEDPAATQAVAPVQDTPDRLPPAAVAWVVHAVPFHRSASPASPTAVQASTALQDTSRRVPPPGVVWIVQVPPFHRSASVPCLIVQGTLKQLHVGCPLLQQYSLQCPTAVQLVPEEHVRP
jgi:hypothetical protein